MVGALSELNLVWEFADSANMLMAIPNLVALLMLNRVIVSETQKYLWNNNLDAEAEAFDITGQYEVCNVCYTNQNRR